MLWKCANPDCEADFNHQHGRYFRFRFDPEKSNAPANTHSVRHYWMCRECAKIFTLEYREGLGLVLRGRNEVWAREEASRGPVAA